MVTTMVQPVSTPSPSREELLSNIVKLVEKEYNSGNKSISPKKYQTLLRYQEQQQQQQQQQALFSNSREVQSYLPPRVNPFKQLQVEKLHLPAFPRPHYLRSIGKFKAPKSPEQNTKLSQKKSRSQGWSIRHFEDVSLGVMETMANALDNLYLLSKLPMFPKKLTRLLRHTNSIWVVILVFLVRKTISQLINVLRRERKVKNEMAILYLNYHSLLIQPDAESRTFKRYSKVLKNLKFDKMMLGLELVGNFLDLAFNLIELYNISVPNWLMSFMNVISMSMTVYRMNKDDEYVNDDISEDIL